MKLTVEQKEIQELEESLEKSNWSESELICLLARAVDSISEGMDDEECRFDHHGYCQEHMWFHTEKRCPNARAMELLNDLKITG